MQHPGCLERSKNKKHYFKVFPLDVGHLIFVKIPGAQSWTCTARRWAEVAEVDLQSRTSSIASLQLSFLIEGNRLGVRTPTRLSSLVTNRQATLQRSVNRRPRTRTHRNAGRGVLTRLPVTSPSRSRPNMLHGYNHHSSQPLSSLLRSSFANPTRSWLILWCSHH